MQEKIDTEIIPSLQAVETEANTELDNIMEKQANDSGVAGITSHSPVLESKLTDEQIDDRHIDERREKRKRHTGEVIRLRQQRDQYKDLYERQRLEYEAELRSRDKQLVSEREHALRIKTDVAKNAIGEALENGDNDRLAKAVELLGEFAVEKSNLERVDPYVNYAPEAPVYYDQQPQIQQAEEVSDDEFYEWSAEPRNEWCNPNSRRFNQKLASKAAEMDAFYRESASLSADPETHKMIGSREYYDFIGENLKREYGLIPAEKPINNAPTERSEPKRSGHIAPAVQGSEPYFYKKDGKNWLNMPTDFRRSIETWVPNLDMVNHKTGRQYSAEEKMALYTEEYLQNKERGR